MRRRKKKGARDEAVYISMAQIAAILGWRTERAREWLRKEGATIRIGRQYYTTRSRLRAEFPEILDGLDGMH